MGILTDSQARLTTIITTEFAADGVILRPDRLHASMGSDGNHYCGISPLGEGEHPDDAGRWTAQMMIQMYRAFDPQIDPEQQVDPTTIQLWAERLRQAARTQVGIGTDDAWYFRITEFAYPPDPTGNMTRFHASILTYGNNDGMFA